MTYYFSGSSSLSCVWPVSLKNLWLEQHGKKPMMRWLHEILYIFTYIHSTALPILLIWKVAKNYVDRFESICGIVTLNCQNDMIPTFRLIWPIIQILLFRMKWSIWLNLYIQLIWFDRFESVDLVTLFDNIDSFDFINSVDLFNTVDFIDFVGSNDLFDWFE